MENPAQQVQWQNGEQSSFCASLFWVDDLSTVLTVSLFKALVSAQGKKLCVKTIKAMRKAKIFIGCKGKYIV